MTEEQTPETTAPKEAPKPKAKAKKTDPMLDYDEPFAEVRGGPGPVRYIQDGNTFDIAGKYLGKE